MAEEALSQKSLLRPRYSNEQDDVNRAREEFNVLIASSCLAVPARGDFKANLNSALYVRTAYSHFGANFLCASSDGIDAMYTKITGILGTDSKAKYPSPYFSCTWRAPYNNKKVSTSTCSAHLKGAACDCKPAGSSQTAQNFSDQFDDIKASFDHWILEDSAKVLRSWYTLQNKPTSGGWEGTQGTGDPHSRQGWDYVDSASTPKVADGYKVASHYHLEAPK